MNWQNRETERSALVTEVTTDPESRGYADCLSADNPARALQLLLCNGYEIANPVEQTQIPATLTVSAMLGLLSNEALAAIPDTMLATLREDIRSQDRDAVGNWASIGVVKSWITTEQRDAILAAIAETVADPKWIATVLATPRLRAVTNDTMGGITLPQCADLVAEMEA